MSLDSINLLTTLDQGLFGLTLFLAPNYFWNPVDGLFPSFAKATALESNLFDTLTRMFLMGSGATMTSFLLFHLFFMKNETDKTTFLHVKLVAYLARFVLFVHTAFFNPSEMLNKEFFAFAASATGGMVLWTLDALLCTSAVKHKPHKATNRRTASALFGLSRLTFTLLCAIILIFFPVMLSPKGALPFVLQISTEDDNFDALQLVAARFQGTNLLCVAALLWDFPDPPPKDLTYWSFIYSFLYWLVFLIGCLDETGILSKKAYIGQLSVQSAIFAVALQVDEIERSPAKNSMIQRKSS